MDEQQRRQLDEQGYLIFKHVLAPAEIEGQPGDVRVFNGHCRYAGRPNETDKHRRGVLVHYLRADVSRPQIVASIWSRRRVNASCLARTTNKSF